MPRHWMLLPALCLAALLAGASHAQPAATDDFSCRNGAFPAEQGEFALAKVVGAGRLHLLGDMNGCPREGDRNCLGHGYVVPGDTLITGRSRGAYRCAFFPNDQGGSAGWVEARRLQPLQPSPGPELDGWTGHWADGDNTLVFGRQGAALTAKGEAYWPEANPPQEQFPGGPNLGEMDGMAVPVGSTAVFHDGECTLHAHLLGDFLVVGDNGQCGGMNVRFDGVYRRRNRSSATSPAR